MRRGTTHMPWRRTSLMSAKNRFSSSPGTAGATEYMGSGSVGTSGAASAGRPRMTLRSSSGELAL